jgi:hypothetical protein
LLLFFRLYAATLGTSYISKDNGRYTKTTEFYKFPTGNLHNISLRVKLTVLRWYVISDWIDKQV